MVRHFLGLIAVAALTAALAAKDIDPDPKSLEVPAEIDRKARDLIRVLASASYSEREQADRELKALGRFALPAIRDTFAATSNAEVQLRCDLLLPRATSEDVKARVECFLADTKSEFDHKLPGAREYFEIVGKSEGSRDLFRDMILSANQKMLFAIGGSPDELAKAIVARRGEFRPYSGSVDALGRAGPNAIDIAAIFLAESCVADSLLPRNASQANQFINQPVLRATLESGANKEVYLALLSRWVDSREDAYSLYYAMTLSTSLKLPLGMKCAAKLLNAKIGPASYRGMAMTFIAKNGKPEDAKAFEPMLRDKTVLVTTMIVGLPGGNRRIPIQARDAALAMTLLMNKLDPVEFGMTARTKSASQVLKQNYSFHCFDDADGDADKKRDAAFEKFEAWKAAEKKKN